MSTSPTPSPDPKPAARPRPEGQRWRETPAEAEARRAAQRAVIASRTPPGAASLPPHVFHDDLRHHEDFDQVLRDGKHVSWCRAMPDHREPGVVRWFLVDRDGRRTPPDARGSATDEMTLRSERMQRGRTAPEQPL